MISLLFKDRLTLPKSDFRTNDLPEKYKKYMEKYRSYVARDLPVDMKPVNPLSFSRLRSRHYMNPQDPKMCNWIRIRGHIGEQTTFMRWLTLPASLLLLAVSEFPYICSVWWDYIWAEVPQIYFTYWHRKLLGAHLQDLPFCSIGLLNTDWICNIGHVC